MTRETKAGLVVSCSFLCLVGVVLVTKLRERAAAMGDPEVSTSIDAPDDPTPAPEDTPRQAAEDARRRPATKSNGQSTNPAGLTLAAHFPDVPSSPLDKDHGGKPPSMTFNNQSSAGAQRKDGQAAGLNGPDLSPGSKGSVSDQTPDSKGVPPKAVADLNSRPATAPTDSDREFEKLLERLKKQTSEQLTGSAAKGQAPPTTSSTATPVWPSDAGRAGNRSPAAGGFEPKSGGSQPSQDVSTTGAGNSPKPLPPPPLDPFMRNDRTAAATGTDGQRPDGGLKSSAAGPSFLPSSGSSAAAAATAPLTSPAPPVFNFGSASPSASGSAGSATGNTGPGTTGLTSTPGAAGSTPPPAFNLNSSALGSASAPPAPFNSNANGPSTGNQGISTAGQESKPATTFGGGPSFSTGNADRPGVNPTATRTEPSLPPTPNPAEANPAGSIQLVMPSIQPIAPPVPAGGSGNRNLIAQGPSTAATFSPGIGGTSPRPAYEATAGPAPGTGAAVVESYDEETYTSRPNDNFRTISRTYFQDERYAQALWQFNRDHPLASEQMRQGMDQLPSGTSIYIPPLRILQKYYSQATAEPGPAQPEARGAISPASALTPAPQPRQPSYQVRGDGEMLRDIARKTLNDPERWTEIYQLNRRYDPSVPVPAGTELRLPGDARVE